MVQNGADSPARVARTTRRSFIAGVSASLLPMERGLAAGLHHDFRSVRQRITELVAAEQATGVAVAVAHRGQIIWEEGFGWADQAAGRRVTPHTPFCLASITKSFTTTLVVSLAAEGKVSLDAPAGRYLDSRAPPGPNGDPLSATVRQLGAHAGGLPTIFEMFVPGHVPAPPSLDAVLRSYGALAFPPGEVYEYSNVGYAMLGAIAERVTGQAFGRLMTERVLQPLGMRDSFFGTDAGRLDTRALCYEAAGKVLPYYTTTTPPSGELYVSAHDLARFAIFNLPGRGRRDRAILEDRWLAELRKPVLTGPQGGSSTFGWFCGRTQSGLEVFCKSGGQVGVATILYFVPSLDLACAVLTNRSDNYPLVHDVAAQVLGIAVPSWRMPVLSPEPVTAPFALRPEYAGRWEGRLMNDGVDLRVVLEVPADGRCTLAIGAGAPEPIRDLQLEGAALVGNTSGLIDSPEAIRTAATNLEIKLLPYSGRLAGRVIASAVRPGTMVPYVLGLSRPILKWPDPSARP